MSERLNLQDLVDLLAKKQGLTKKESELFLRELIALVTENIENIEPVKIKDFGTLKPTKVNTRKSVNVNTGEEFEIPAHYKLSFLPDKTLRDIVNKPFAHFESVILEDGVSFDNINIESADDENDTDDETDNETTQSIISPQDNKVSPVQDKPVDTAEIEQVESESLNTVEEDENIPAMPTAEVEENIEPSVEPAATVKTENETISTESDDFDEGKIYNADKKKKAIIVSCLCLLFLIGGLALHYTGYLRQFMIDQGWCIKPEANMPTDSVAAIVPTKADSAAIIVDSTSTNNGVIASPADSTIVEPEEKPVTTSPKPRTATIEYGTTLRSLGLKHYGRKSFWVYIYMENKDKIKNPNSVPVGTELILPPASKYGIDANDPKSVEKAKEIEIRLFEQMGL